MRRIVVFLALLTALAAPAALVAAKATDGTLSVKRGRGSVVLKLKGTVIGRAKQGRVRIVDLRAFDNNVPHVTGCKVRHPALNVTTCAGRNIAFRVDERRYNISVQGSGIWISAVGRGFVTIDGAGETGRADGVMSIDNAPYESLPDFPTTFYLGAPQPVR